MAAELMGTDHIRQQFRAHLESIGFEFHGNPEIIHQKLRQRMGEQRYSEFVKAAGGPRSAHKQEELYHYFQDIVEGNLMRSMDKSATLDASFSLYEQCHTRLWDDMRVLELGCWTGGLASFIATRHLTCSVVGVDFEPKIVNDCKAHYQLPNLSFQHWNYRWAKPQTLEPADVLLCSMGVVHHMPKNTCSADPRQIRQSGEYIKQREHATGYFSLWRTAANPGATFYAALRLTLLTRFVAWIDAARDSGWRPRLDRLWNVEMAGEKHALPGLVFEAGECDPLEEEAIVDAWTRFELKQDFYAKLDGGAAFGAFRSMQQKRVLAERNYAPQQLATRDEVGIAGGTGYVFTSDAVSKFRLLLISQRRATELAATISQKDCTRPISDEATIVEPSTEPPPQVRGAFFAGSSLPQPRIVYTTVS